MSADDMDQSAPCQDPWLRLEKLIEREFELVRAGRLDDLQAAVRMTGEHIARLPRTPPRSARLHIVRARALRERIEIELGRKRDRLDEEHRARRKSHELRRTYSTLPNRRYSISA